MTFKYTGPDGEEIEAVPAAALNSTDTREVPHWVIPAFRSNVLFLGVDPITDKEVVMIDTAKQAKRVEDDDYLIRDSEGIVRSYSKEFFEGNFKKVGD